MSETVPLHQDIWLGDSIELCKRFKGTPVNCVIADPPFGVDNLSNMAVTPGGKEYATKILNDETPEQAIAVFKAVMDSLLPKTTSHSDAYIFTSYQVLSDWLVMTDEFMPTHGFNRKAIITWDKGDPGMGDTNCPWGMGQEYILFFQKGRRPKDATRQNAVITIPKLRPNQLIHPHEKPEQLYEKLIRTSTEPGDWVVDPFGGSGVAARAARNCGRNAISIELDEVRFNRAMHKFATQEENMFAGD